MAATTRSHANGTALAAGTAAGGGASGAPLPYGMRPAPAVAPRVSAPVDLGTWNPVYTGWCVVFDLGVELDMYQTIRAAQSAESGLDTALAMLSFLESVVVAWNFTKTDAHGVTRALPQPREGGAALCPQEVLLCIARAFGEVVMSVPKDSETR